MSPAAKGLVSFAADWKMEYTIVKLQLEYAGIDSSMIMSSHQRHVSVPPWQVYTYRGYIDCLDIEQQSCVMKICEDIYQILKIAKSVMDLCCLMSRDNRGQI